MNSVTITFTSQQLEVLNAALMELPFKMASPLINEINRQIREQHDSAPPQEVDEIVE